ncbi:hypothetical protein F2Q70_00038586 [Brassica cretica]|uniref:Uncharacterized protein n=1 Tax=Brassica cretica TaxID=69181 RepID=A0A8S9KAL3_BRACR|nr:hypothetical protein F2Q70_00038586 [Brassica cretica]
MRHKAGMVCASLSMLSKLPKTHVQPKVHWGPQSTNVKSTYIKTLQATRYREHMVYTHCKSTVKHREQSKSCFSRRGKQQVEYSIKLDSGQLPSGRMRNPNSKKDSTPVQPRAHQGHYIPKEPLGPREETSGSQKQSKDPRGALAPPSPMIPRSFHSNLRKEGSQIPKSHFDQETGEKQYFSKEKAYKSEGFYSLFKIRFRPLRPYRNPEVSSLDPEIFDWTPEEPGCSSLYHEIFDWKPEAIGEPGGTVLRLPRQDYYRKSLTSFRGCWCGCYDPSARLRCFPRLEKHDFDCSLYFTVLLQ